MSDRPLPIDSHFKNARRIAHEYCENHNLNQEAENNLEIELRTLIISVHNDVVTRMSNNIIGEISHALRLKYGYK